MDGAEKNAAFLIAIAFASLVWALPVLWKRRWIFPLFGFVGSLWTLICLWYFLYFHRYLPFSSMAGLLRETTGLVTTNSLPYYPTLWVACIFLVDSRRRPEMVRPIAVAAAGLFLVSVALGAWWWGKDFNGKQFGEDLKYFGDTVFVRRFGLLSWQVRKLVEPRPVLPYSPRVMSSSGRKDHRNIVLIQIESLDAAAVRWRWNGRPVMPFLDKLSRSARYYPAVMSYHKGGGTSDAELSLVNSVDPFDDRAAIMDDRLVYSNSFVKRLADAGYATMVFHGNTGKFWNRSTAFPAMGYGRFEDTFTMPLRQNGWGIPDRDVFSYVLTRLSVEVRSNRKFFCHIITMSTHEPYNLAGRYFTNREFDSVPDPLTARFFLSLNYLDRCLEEFVPKLVNLPDTEVFLIGDHSAIEMKGFACSRVSVESALLDFVPFFHITYKPRSEEVDLAGSFLDIAPTILFSSGVPFTILSDGENLLFPLNPRGIVKQDGRSWTREELFRIWSKRTGISGE
jgi:hypothetical protein